MVSTQQWRSRQHRAATVAANYCVAAIGLAQGSPPAWPVLTRSPRSCIAGAASGCCARLLLLYRSARCLEHVGDCRANLAVREIGHATARRHRTMAIDGGADDAFESALHA